MALKLRQGQVGKTADEFVQIVHLERLQVKYKTMRDLKSDAGEHRTGTKKDFCRLIKNATLLSAKGPSSIAVVTEKPTEETPTTEAPVEEAPVEEAPAEETSVEETSDTPATE